MLAYVAPDPARHLYVIRLQDPVPHRAVFAALRAGGIGVNLHYIPLHCQPYFEDFLGISGDWPEADNYYQTAISLPLFHHMTDEQQEEVVRVLREALT